MLSDTRILYVDDDWYARRKFARSLKERGVQVECASSGEEALQLVQANSYAVIATDLMMPKMNGLQLIEQLYSASPGPAFVLVTGANTLNLPTDTASARSVTSVIQKPWNIDQMVEALEHARKLHDTGVQANDSEQRSPERVVSILLVEDNPGDANLVQTMLGGVAGHTYEVTHVTRLADAIVELELQTFQLVLVDQALPDARGMDSVSRLHTSFPATPIIVLSGLSDEALAVQTVQMGAQDYLVKGEVTSRDLHRSISYAIERKRTEERLLHLAHYDQMTGLANRTLFQKRADRALARARRLQSHVAILLLDLDRFKVINDTMGHDAGDQILIEVAERLSNTAREVDTVARLGGDEFAVLIEDVSEEENLGVPAKRIIDALNAPVLLDGHEIRPTTSIGIAVFPQNGDNLKEMLKSADSAMYRAQENGRNSYQFCDKEMHANASKRMELERDLSGALERQEFLLHYQPLTSASTNHVVCFEALLRWKHPRFGLVRPDEFIPLLEDLGLIVDVGEWVLQRACTQIRAWQRDFDADFRVAVNVSARQFDDPDLSAKVAHALQSADLKPSCLDFEVTEGMIMRDADTATRTLRELKSLGVRIAIDDFGTGYTRLEYLVRFPIDVLKVDRSVVQTIGEAGGDKITTAVIELGHTLGLEIVAEGVEEVQQLDFLRALNCDTIQGYINSRPLPPDDCLTWLRTRRTLRCK